MQANQMEYQVISNGHNYNDMVDPNDMATDEDAIERKKVSEYS